LGNNGRLPFDREGYLDPRVFPPPATYSSQDLAAIRETDPVRYVKHLVYESLMELLGVRTASAPTSAAEAERDARNPGVSPAQQAFAIANAMIPVEKLLGLAGTSVLKEAGTVSASEWRSLLRRFLSDERGGLRIPATALPPLERGSLALAKIAASEQPIVLRDLTSTEVKALVDKYGSGVAVALRDHGTIASYDALSAATRNISHVYQAHHIVEVQVLKLLDLPSDVCPSVILSTAEHRAVTAALAREIPPGHIEAMTKTEIRQAYERAYRGHPEWIAEVRRYFP
jgi:hypothetical protein